MSEKASSIIGHRRSEAGTNLTPPEETQEAPVYTNLATPPKSSTSPGTYPSAARPSSKPRYNKGEKSFLSKLFSFSGRTGRGAYILIVLICDFFIYSLSVIPDDTDEKYFGLWLLILPVFLWIRIAGNTRRCHDFGRSGWWQVIPFFVLWMLFAPGDEYPNEYDD